MVTVQCKIVGTLLLKYLVVRVHSHNGTIMCSTKERDDLFFYLCLEMTYYQQSNGVTHSTTRGDRNCPEQSFQSDLTCLYFDKSSEAKTCQNVSLKCSFC